MLEGEVSEQCYKGVEVSCMSAVCSEFGKQTLWPAVQIAFFRKLGRNTAAFMPLLLSQGVLLAILL